MGWGEWGEEGAVLFGSQKNWLGGQNQSHRAVKQQAGRQGRLPGGGEDEVGLEG
jgi:hypothetical protein